MKKMHWMGAVALIMMAILALGCVSGGEAAAPAAPVIVLFDFETFDGNNFYSPGDALTTPDSGSMVEQSMDQAFDGSASMKITGTLQQDKYDGSNPPKTIEIGMRMKAAQMAGLSNCDVKERIISMRVFVEEGANNPYLQFALQDKGYQQAISDWAELTPGEWTTIYFKLASSGSLDQVDSEGNVLVKGAYTSDSFSKGGITQLEFRSVGDTSVASVGDPATVYIDAVEWVQ